MEDMRWGQPEIDAARAKADARHRAASEKHPQYSDEWFAENQILHLEEITREGIAACYTGVDDFMVDFWMDFSWDKRASIQVRLILTDPRFEAIQRWFLDTHNTDLKARLEAAV